MISFICTHMYNITNKKLVSVYKLQDIYTHVHILQSLKYKVTKLNTIQFLRNFQTKLFTYIQRF